jgi:hypothetical protein
LIKENRHDELEPSGRLFTKVDNRIIDLQSGATLRLPFGSDPASLLNAMGHSDNGFGYILGTGLSDRPGATRLWKLDGDSIDASVVYFDHHEIAAAGAYFSHSNAQRGTAPEKQYACTSNGIRKTDDIGQTLGPQPRSDEIVCFRLDGSLDVLVVAPVMASIDAPGGDDPYMKLPKGNLDVTGRYYIWTGNLFGNRLDAFLVELPAQLLTGSADKGPPPPPWSAEDIGAAGEAGSALFSNGTFTVRGAGGDIFGGADAFHYVFQPLSGNGQIIAQLGSLQNKHEDDADVQHQQWEKAGIMIRESLDAAASNAFLAVSRSQGAVFQRRHAPAGETLNAALSNISAPCWIKLTRKGNVFSAFLSKDGKTLATFDRVTVGPITK